MNIDDMLSSLPEDVTAELFENIAAGRRIEAIKVLREATGLSLREARAAVIDLEHQFTPDESHSAAPPPPQFTEEGGGKSLAVIGVALIAAYLLYRYFMSA